MDTIRVIRIYEFVGPRNIVESTIAKSILGEKRITKQQGGPLMIRAATLGTFPEILNSDEESNYSLRMYACGYNENVNEYAMFAGPFDSLDSAIQVIPDDNQRGKS